MKALLVSALFLIIGSQAMAADRNYQCIADSLQAYNSDIYYNLSSTDIDAMITIPEMMGHIDAIEAEKRCNQKEDQKQDQNEDKQYQCVADALQAYNSSIYCNLSRSDVEAMLTIPEMFGHIDAVNAAKRCGLR